MSSDDPVMPRRRLGVWPIVWLTLLVVGLGAWSISGLAEQPARAWRAVLINLMFFTPLAVGMVVWSAVVMASQGRWNAPVERLGLCGVMFAPAPVIALAALWAAAPQWAPWISRRTAQQAAWLNVPMLFGRDFAAMLLMWLLAILYVRRRRHGRPVKLAGTLVFVYCVVLSLLGFDLIMAMDPRWYSTLFGGYTFISGMYIAVAGWALLAVLMRPDRTSQLHDLGKLVVAFSLLTTYMMYSQLMVIWYENLPAEVVVPLPRLADPALRNVSAALLATVYLGPLVILLTRRSKRTPAFLGATCLMVLCGMWVERWWLVAPMPGAPAAMGMPELSMTAAFLGAFGLAMTWGLRSRWIPEPMGVME